jgi:hypothetical protein
LGIKYYHFWQQAVKKFCRIADFFARTFLRKGKNVSCDTFEIELSWERVKLFNHSDNATACWFVTSTPFLRKSFTTWKAKASGKADAKNKGKEPVIKPVKVERDQFDLSQHEDKGMLRCVGLRHAYVENFIII